MLVLPERPDDQQYWLMADSDHIPKASNMTCCSNYCFGPELSREIGLSCPHCLHNVQQSPRSCATFYCHMVVCTSPRFLVRVSHRSALCLVPSITAKQSIYRPDRQTSGPAARKPSCFQCKSVYTQEALDNTQTMDENQRWRQRWYAFSTISAALSGQGTTF